MDMRHNRAVPQRLHGIAQNVPADRLNDVLHEFRAVAFQTRPLLRGVCAHVGDGGAAELILPDAGLYVSQPPPGRQRDKQHTRLTGEANAVCFRCGLIDDSPCDGPVNFPPQLDDHGIGCAPGVHQRLEFVFLKPHFDSAHRLERAHGAAIAERQFRDFALLT